MSYRIRVDVYDPWADPCEVLREYGITTSRELPDGKYDTVVVSVGHRQFNYEMIRRLSNKCSVLFDVKSILDKELADARL
jgi:UDP-N-acetyl-D-galactosamine dehydrogenase